MIYEKMLFLSEENVGSAKGEQKKDEGMLKEQEELLKQIDQERMKLKEMREA